MAWDGMEWSLVRCLWQGQAVHCMDSTSMGVQDWEGDGKGNITCMIGDQPRYLNQ